MAQRSFLGFLDVVHQRAGGHLCDLLIFYTKPFQRVSLKMVRQQIISIIALINPILNKGHVIVQQVLRDVIF